MLMYKPLFIAIALCSALHTAAQSEAGLLMSAAAEKQLSKRISVDAEVEMRSRNNLKTIDRWSFGLGATYRFNKWLKADAGYNFMEYNFRESTSYKASGKPNNWRPEYWGPKHRFHASLTGQYKLACGIKLSLRERWQYTYRPEQTVTRWDYDNDEWEEKVRSSKGKHQLRSRLQIGYDNKRLLLMPYASAELYNAWSTEKIKYTIGTNIRLSKHHTLDVFYRFQDMKNVDADDYDPDMHYLGMGYKFSF